MARLLCVLIVVAPLAISVVFTWLAGVVVPPERLGVHRWVWIGPAFVAANLLLVAVDRANRRLLPLVAMMKLTRQRGEVTEEDAAAVSRSSARG